MEDFRRHNTKEHLKDLTLEERLKGLSIEQIKNHLQRRKLAPTSPPKRKKKK